MSQCKECEVWNEPGLAILLNNFHLPDFPGSCTGYRHTLKENTSRREGKNICFRKREERMGKKSRGEGCRHHLQHCNTQESLLICVCGGGGFNGLREKTASILLPATRSFLFWLHNRLAILYDLEEFSQISRSLSVSTHQL